MDTNEYGWERNSDFAETPEFTLGELLAMMREQSARYEVSVGFEGAATRAEAAMEIDRLAARIRADYPAHYGR